jgi:AcrR family transcriptional regulator
VGRSAGPDSAETGLPTPDELPEAARQRRAHIVATALELLSDHEYEAIQMREVAERARVSTATMYRYFSSKEHLYAEVLLVWFLRFRDRTRRPLAGATDADRLRSELLRTIRLFQQEPRIWRTEIALQSSTDPNAQRVHDEFAAVHASVLTGVLTDVGPDDAAEIVVIANTVLGMHLRKWATGRCTIADVRRTVSRCVDLIFDGPTFVDGHR